MKPKNWKALAEQSKAKQVLIDQQAKQDQAVIDAAEAEKQAERDAAYKPLGVVFDKWGIARFAATGKPVLNVRLGAWRDGGAAGHHTGGWSNRRR